MAYVNKRITELPERSALNPDDYTVVDGDTGGTAKFKLADMDDDISNLKTIFDDLADEVENLNVIKIDANGYFYVD